MSCIDEARVSVRREADLLESTHGRGGFRRRRTLDDSDRSKRIVARAVSQARLGDHDAVRFLYLRYADNVYGYVCSLVRDDHEAEDVTQQIFAKLTKSLQRYEPRVVPFSAWILRVAHNAAIDHVRVRRAIPCDEVRAPSEIDESLSRERYHDLCDALDTLPEDQRNVMKLRFIVGLSPGEIAERIGRSEDAIHGLQHRGRRALKAELVRLAAAPTVAAA